MSTVIYTLAFIGTACILVTAGFLIAACWISRDNDTDAEKDSKEIVE